MKIFKLVLFVIVYLPWAHAGFSQSVAKVSPDHAFTIESKILNESCRVLVSLPENYSATTERFPVVYVLDGEYYLSFTADASALLAQSQLAPYCIVIGITTNNRDRDFAPPVDKDSGQTRDLETAGGADKFLSYLMKELIPTVDQKYRTTPYRVLVGHSTGGLLAYYSLYKTPALFHAIVAIDASTWWNKGKVGREVIDYLTQHPDYRVKIFECRKDVSIPVRFPVNKELLSFLENKRPKGVEFTYLEMPNETHGTIVFPGTYFGLKGIFSDYKKN